jgi:hypothetical protein
MPIMTAVGQRPDKPSSRKETITMSKTVALLLTLAAALAVAPRAHAQALPIGTISVSNLIVPCTAVANGSLFFAGMSCQSATISCPNTASIQLTFGYAGPASPQGTVVFFSGGSGLTPTESGDDILTYAASYANTFEIVQVEWNSAWEDPSSNGAGGNILTAACRPATFLNYINVSNIHQQGAMCSQGSSAGGAAIAYSMAWYGAANYLNNVEFTSGPVLSEIDQGCTYPNASTPTICGPGDNAYCSPKTVPWSDEVIYVPNYNQGVSNWSGIPGPNQINGVCGTSTVNPANYPLWAAMSTVDGASAGATPTFNYPNTTKHGWLCQSLASGTGPPNNSGPEGKFFYDAVNATGDNKLVVTGIEMCQGAEGTAGGIDPDNTSWSGSEAVGHDMLNQCKVP